MKTLFNTGEIQLAEQFTANTEFLAIVLLTSRVVAAKDEHSKDASLSTIAKAENIATRSRSGAKRLEIFRVGVSDCFVINLKFLRAQNRSSKVCASLA